MRKFLVCVDGSEIMERVIAKAIERVEKEGGRLLVLYVIEDFCPIGLTEVDCDTIRHILEKEGKNILEKVSSYLKEKGIESETIMKEGRPADVILEVAEAEKVDEIFVGSHGKHGAKKFFLGSVSSRVVEMAKCPVTVVK